MAKAELRIKPNAKHLRPLENLNIFNITNTWCQLGASSQSAVERNPKANNESNKHEMSPPTP